MIMFARFDENPAMTPQVLKKKNVTDGHTDARTDNVKTVYPTTNKVCEGYKEVFEISILRRREILHLSVHPLVHQFNPIPVKCI